MVVGRLKVKVNATAGGEARQVLADRVDRALIVRADQQQDCERAVQVDEAAVADVGAALAQERADFVKQARPIPPRGEQDRAGSAAFRAVSAAARRNSGGSERNTHGATRSKLLGGL